MSDLWHEAFVGRHAPDPVSMEIYWMWHCTCGDSSDAEFATREDAEDAAEAHAHGGS